MTRNLEAGRALQDAYESLVACAPLSTEWRAALAEINRNLELLDEAWRARQMGLTSFDKRY